MASEKDVQDVIRTLIAEGVGEGQEGMRRIAETILNRAEQRGISPAEVVRQRAQYTGYERPGSAAVQAFNDPKALTAAQAAWQMAQGPDDPTGGANHYFNPNIVTPSWARSMTPTGTYGGHAFYTDRPYTQQGALPRTAPAPASQTPLMASSRAVTSPSGGNSQLQPALNRIATLEGNRVTPASVDDRLMARANAVMRSGSGFNGDPMTPANGQVVASIPTRSQSYAGQDRALFGSAFGGDPLTPSNGPIVATIPTRPVSPVSRAPISYAGQERAPTRYSPTDYGRDPLTPSAAPPIMSIPTAQRSVTSGIGHPPATRTVQSIPVRPTSAIAAPTLAQTRNEQIAMRARPPMNGAGSMPTFQALQDMAGQRINPNAPNRLSPSLPMVATYGTMQPQQVASIGVPAAPAITAPRRLPPVAAPSAVGQARPTAVGTQLAVTPQRASMPLAQARAPMVQQRPFPLMAAAPPPLNILVQGSNTAQPAPVQPRIWLSDLVNGGRSGGSTSSVSYGGGKSAF